MAATRGRRRRCILSQPGVSLQVKALEKSIGLPLFEKVGRTLQLTAAGTSSWGTARRFSGCWKRRGW